MEEENYKKSIRNNADCPLHHHIISYGKYAKKEAIMYADWLIITVNSSIPNETWARPNPHLCTITITNVNDFDEDYKLLVNTVERHTKCNPITDFVKNLASKIHHVSLIILKSAKLRLILLLKYYPVAQLELLSLQREMIFV